MENESTKKCSTLQPITKEDYARKLKDDLSKIKLESGRKDNIIKELSSLPCYDKKKDTNLFDGFNVRAELATFQLRVNEIQNELLEKISENQNQTGTINVLKFDNVFLKEVNARQKATLESFKVDLSSLNSFNETLQIRINECLEKFNISQKQIDFYKQELEIKETNLRDLNECIEEANMKNTDNNSKIEEILTNLYDDKEFEGLTEAATKVKHLITENKKMKTQLHSSIAEISSFKCEQKLSRETIIRLSNELKFEKQLRVGMEQKIYKLMQDFDEYKKTYEYNNKEINCLRDQITELQNALKKSAEEDIKKTETIMNLLENNKSSHPPSKDLDYLNIFIIKAEEILSNFYNGNASDPRDIEWVMQCLKKLVTEIQHFSEG